MSRFNTKSQGTKTVNLAGGQAYSQSPELELVSVLLTSFAQDQFYRSTNDTFDRLKELIRLNDPEFTAKAAIYARREFGMRSITHVVAAELSGYLSGKDYARKFYEAIIYRPDDITEILSVYGKKPNNAMKKGFSDALGRFNEYQIAKYRGEGNKFKLVDAVNILHPKPTEKNAEALKKLVSGGLKSTETWEAMLSAAGPDADKKAAVWRTLLSENKLGYFALLLNLRNIIEQAPGSVDLALERLTNKEAIQKSLVLPFRFLSAYTSVRELTDGAVVRKAMRAINTAADLSLSNVPKLKGDTLVVLDTSGSMGISFDSGNPKSPATIGALFAAAMVKSNDCDFMTFDNTARFHNLNASDSLITLAESIRFNGGGTNFPAIFDTMRNRYDRIIILSDMQGWIGYWSPAANFNAYKQRTGANPMVYSFDLQNYGSMQLPEQNVVCLAGFSEKVFDIMTLIEQDKKALINTIKAYEL